jgi:conjugative relaxase-like TrwC/TraI family protein
VLSIKNLSSSIQAAHYYERDDYYVGGTDRSPSRWWGLGAEHLGLTGSVDRDAFTRLLEGELPDGTTLPRRPDQKRRPGFDLTFSAPKSVSIAALVDGDERIIDAHSKAVDSALRYLETRASFARVKDEGGSIRPVQTGHLVVASFLHDTSRELDPQLHTHAVVLNATKTKDGGWRALTNEELLRSKMVGGAIYRAELALSLQALGYDVERTHADGRFELAGYTKEQLRGFSQRRAEIEAALKSRGFEGAKAAEIAALDTRDAKREVDRRELRRLWRDRASALGIDLARPSSRAPRRDHASGAEYVRSATAHLAERKSVFFEREIVARAAAFGLGKVGIAEIEAAVRQAHRRGDLVDAKNARDTVGRRYTTKDAIAREADILTAMRFGQGQLPPIEPRIEARVFEAAGLTRGQREAVELVLTTRDRVVAIQGYAGTGKTAALSKIRDLSEAAGVTVHGFAMTRAAANVLAETGIESTTLADHLSRPQQREAADGSLRPRELWVLDEASLLGTTDALRFLRAAERRDARVVLVGDRAQLPAIEAGRPFALMVDRGVETVTMNEIKRQRDPDLKAAVEATIGQDLERALAALRPSVYEIESRAERIQAIADAYLEGASCGASPLVLTGSNADRRAINETVREGRDRRGELSGTPATARVLVKADRTKVEARQAASYSTGDVLRFGRMYRKLGVDRGEYGEIVGIHAESNELELRRSDGTIVRFSPARTSQIEAYAIEERELRSGDRIRFTRNDRERGRTNGEEAVVVAVDPNSACATIARNGQEESLDLRTERHWDHGYARTVYAAQGRTADRAILHIDTSDRKLNGYESWYVGISRARDEVQIFTDDATQLPNVIQRALGQEIAIDVVLPKIELEQSLANARGPSRGLDRGVAI